MTDIRFLRPRLPSLDDVGRYFAAAQEERWFSNFGPCHRLLTQRLSAYVGPGVHCVLVANATLGLLVALRALVDGAGRSAREVIVPSFTFPAAVQAITWCGLEPVFADLDPETWHLDPEQLELAIEARGDRIAAVVACSTFGTAPPMTVRRRWEAACAAHEIPLLVDSAAGFGTVDEVGQPLGRQGDAEVFSFHATKPFAMSEGGLIVTEDGDLAAEMRLLTNFGLDQRRTLRRRDGINAKLSEIHAAFGLAVLDSFDDILEGRRSRAEHIRRPLETAGFSFQPAAEASTWQFIPALTPSEAERDTALVRAAARGVELRTYFAPPLHQSPPFATTQRLSPLPVTEAFAKRILSLPLADDLTDAEAERIVDCLLGTSSTPSPRTIALTSAHPPSAPREHNV
jgi:dTDP-4-amino-4,6-dideoxygalactose transaminase